MGLDLFNTTVLSTYDSLIKVGDNDTLTGIPKLLSDGRGNDTPIWLSTNSLGIGVTPESGYTFQVSGLTKLSTVTITSNVTANSFIKSGGLSTQFLKADGSVDSNTYQNTNQKGLANGYAPLDSGAKISEAYLPDSIVGQLEYQGTWNATTNTPTLPSASTVKGHYYVTSVAGTYETIEYAIGDWIISNGTSWEKVDNTDAVTTVFGRIGAIVANSNDYSTFYHPLNGDLAANASTATTLKTARLINGTSFNGSSNITTAIWGATRTITIGDTAKSVSGSTNVAWSRAELGITKTNIDALNIDADTLDGQQGSYYAAANSLSNYLPLTGGNLTGSLNLQSNDLKFQGSDSGDIVWYDGNGIEEHRIWDGGINGLNYRYQAGATRFLMHTGNYSSYITKGYIDGLNVDADTLDNLNSTQFLRSDTSDTMSGTLTVDNDIIIKRGAVTYKQAYHSLYVGGDGLDNANTAIYIGNRGDGNGSGYELFYEGVGNDNKLKLISENFGGSSKVAFEVTQDGDVTFPNNVVVEGSINIDAADLSIGAANIIFDTESTLAVRGLIWDVDGGFLSKIDGGGTNGGLVEIYTNLDGAITTGDVFRIKQGSSALTALSIAGNGYTNITSRLAVGKTTAPATTLDVAGSILASGNITLNSGQMLASGGNSAQWTSAYSYSQIGHLPLTGGSLTGDLNLQYSGSVYSRAIKFQGAAGSAHEVGLRANGEGFEIYEPEDGNRVWLTIEDDPSGNPTALKVNSAGGMTPVLTDYNKGSYVTKTFIDNLNVDADTLDGYDSSVMWKKGADIPSGADLNLYTSDGYYHQNANAFAAAGTNYPVALAGMLSVQSDGAMVYQTYQVYDSNTDTYRRGYYNGTWYSWKRVLMDNDSINADTLDGLDSSQFLRSDTSDAMTGNLTITGNVGIGTSSPDSKVHIEDAVNRSMNGSGEGQFQITGNGYTFGIALDATAAHLYHNSAGRSLILGTNEQPRLTIEPYGNVGIGTTSPSNKLSLAGSGQNWNTSPAIKMWDSFNSKGWYVGSANNDVAGDFYIRSVTAESLYPVSANQQFTIKQNGNLGIGTISPSQKLSISGVKNTPIIHLGSTTNDASWAVGDKIGAIEFGSADSSGAGAGVKASISYEVEAGTTGSSNSMIFRSAGTAAGTNNVERMRIDSTGNVGIGTTSPDAKLDIGENNIITLDDTGGSTGFIGLGSYNDGTKNRAQGFSYYGFGIEVDRPNSVMSIRSYDSNGEISNSNITLHRNGNVGVGTTSPQTRLDVVGNGNAIQIRRSNGYASIKAHSDNSGHLILDSYSSSNAVFIQNYVGGNVYLTTGGGNVGIGTSSPGEKLTVSGNGRFSNGSVGTLTIKHNYGYQKPNWAIKLDGDTGTSGGYLSQYINLGGFALEQGATYYGGGPWRTDANSTSYSSINGVNGQIVFYTNTSLTANASFFPTERLRITSGGNVGIGTTAPSAKLEISSSDTIPALLLTSDGGNEQFKIRRYSNNNEQLILGFHSSDYAQIQAVEQGVSYRTLSLNPNGGNVGIGTTSPAMFGSGMEIKTGSQSGLRLSSSTAGGGAIEIGADTTSGYIQNVVVGDSTHFYTSNSTSSDTLAMTLNSSGNLGIGTTSPQARLDVAGGITLTGDINFGSSNGAINLSRGSLITFYEDTSHFHSLSSRNSLFSEADDIRLNTYGAFYVNLDSNNNNTVNADFMVGRHGGTATISDWLFVVNGETGTGTFKGDVIAYGSPSDRSLKENIKPIENALDKVKRLKGVTFDWKQSEDSILKIKEDYGFIAQEVQEVVPELVRKNENGKLSLRDKGIVSILVEAIKEQQQQIDELKKRLDGVTN